MRTERCAVYRCTRAPTTRITFRHRALGTEARARFCARHSLDWPWEWAEPITYDLLARTR
jgi:hypothetical protein